MILIEIEHVTFIFRHNYTLFSIQEVLIENDFDRKFSKSNFSKFFRKPLFPRIIFGFSKSAPTPRYTILESRFPPVMRSRKAGLPFATRARKREFSIQEVRIEDDSDQKFF